MRSINGCYDHVVCYYLGKHFIEAGKNRNVATILRFSISSPPRIDIVDAGKLNNAWKIRKQVLSPEVYPTVSHTYLRHPDLRSRLGCQ